jgi:hypothetical protein
MQDSLFSKMSLDNFEAATRPKVHASWNLHNLLPQDMDFFVMLSSISGVLGGLAQANYAVGNAYQDSLARYRLCQGQRAVSLDLGMMHSVGFAAKHQSVTENLTQQGYLGIKETELHGILSYYCDPSRLLPSSLDNQVITGIQTPEDLMLAGIEEPYWLIRPQFRHLYQMRSSVVDNADGSISNGVGIQAEVIDYGSQIQNASNLDEVTDICRAALINRVARILDISEENIDTTRPMYSYGVDSLVATKIRNWLFDFIQADVAVFELLNDYSIAGLSELIAQRTKKRVISEAIERGI